MDANGSSTKKKRGNARGKRPEGDRDREKSRCLVELLYQSRDEVSVRFAVAHLITLHEAWVIDRVEHFMLGESQEDKEDIVAQVWDGFFVALLKGTVPQNCKSYLFGIIHRKVSDFIATKVKDKAFIVTDDFLQHYLDGERDLLDTTVSISPLRHNPSHIVENTDVAERVLKRMAETPYYEMLCLIIDENLSDQQLATRLNKRPSAIRVQKYRMRSKLIQFFQEEEQPYLGYAKGKDESI